MKTLAAALLATAMLSIFHPSEAHAVPVDRPAPAVTVTDALPLGAGVRAVGYVADDVWTLTWDASWLLAATREGWTPWAPTNGHGPCAALVGDTTAVACADGYVTTS